MHLHRLRALLLTLAVAISAVAGAVALRSGLGLDPVVSVGASAQVDDAEPATAAAGSTVAPSDGEAGAASAAAPTTTAVPAPVRSVAEPGWTPFASVEGVVLVHPAERVERVAFHQSNHEGARALVPAPTAVLSTILESRERLSALTSAVDIVVDPASAIRSPVTGTVKRAGSYNLYCKLMDDYVVIEPDARPGWEVKLLHVQQESVSPGQRVEAGVTPIAAHATPLPFESQVDKHRTADPAWPHVHIEVVDPSIPNVPNGGSGSSC